MKKQIKVYISRPVAKEDYDELVEWWNFYEFTPPAQAVLPDGGTCGIMLEDSNRNKYAAGFVYFTNSPMAWIEFIVSNPDITDKELRASMLKELIKRLEWFAADNGASIVFTSVKNQSLKQRLIESNWSVGDEGTTEMIKIIT